MKLIGKIKAPSHGGTGTQKVKSLRRVEKSACILGAKIVRRRNSHSQALLVPRRLKPSGRHGQLIDNDAP